MKALYYLGEKTMEVRDIPLPAPKSGQYLIRTRSNGICGSDFEGYLGKTGRRLPPMIMGHEVAGIIEEAPALGKFRKGERVVIFPKPFCGECDYCRKGLVNVCPAGICMGVLDQPGSMTEFVAVDEKYLLPFAATLSYNEAAMTEPLAVAYRGAHKLSERELAEADYCMVIGAGPIGLLTIAVLKLRGARNIIACDATDHRLGIARQMGADFTINPRQEDFLDAVRKITGGKMCDFAIEAVGIEATASNSIDCLRIGGTVVWIGNAQKMVSVNMQKIVTTELTVKGNYVYGLEDFRQCLRLLEEKRIDIAPVMTHEYPLGEGVQAFHDQENNREGKILKAFLVS
ncbi:zinc-binding dehydrogenase [uncultured Propionivibrio sp.]|uniref:zinc-dependent alcohol dehydrogenase n=1 Tax=uncultured Propionivibrio sp. TaxID=426737 RepID=UPI0029C0F22C|nr:zinc-binding dehydrogenase [uncultured Propionivibrio sp.]